MSETLEVACIALAFFGGLALMGAGLIRYKGNVADASPELFMGSFGVIGGMVNFLVLAA